MKYPMRKRWGFYAGYPTWATSWPVVRCSPTKRLVGSRLDALTGTQNVGTLLLLPVGTIYHGTNKQY